MKPSPRVLAGIPGSLQRNGCGLGERSTPGSRGDSGGDFSDLSSAAIVLTKWLRNRIAWFGVGTIILLQRLVARVALKFTQANAFVDSRFIF